MATLIKKSYHAKPADIERGWYIIDATGQTVGRLASRVAHVLRGKHKPTITPSVDTGDFVIIVNAE
jgi:large subunit ribosomal protein L13